MSRGDNDKNMFLEEVAAQIAYKPLRAPVVRELEEHIQDRAGEYEAEGLSPEEAERKAVAVMGDAAAIGTEINAVRHVRTNWPLAVGTAVLAALGFLFSIYMDWTPEQSANGFLYYLPGIGVLIITVYKGYPLLIKHWKKLLLLSLILYAAELLYSLLFVKLPGAATILPWIPLHMTGYFEILLLAPILSVALYCFRNRGAKAILAVFALSGILMTVRFFWLYSILIPSAIAIGIFSLSGAVFFLIHRDGFANSRTRRKGILYGVAAASLLTIISLYLSLPYQRELTGLFLKPETDAYSMWNDGYNGVLIKELLSRTPFAEGLNLSPEELMNYGTGRWYFEDRDPEEMAVLDASGDRNSWNTEHASNSDYRRGIPFHYDESNVTLWNILPQHYHNNYRIAVAIFLYGWLGGIAVLAALAGFYVLLFRCILSIRGKLAGTLSFSCGLCLLLQGILYVLGNFGYQYGNFTNLPLVSEGSLSIIVNMMFLGFIFSAYRYDHVIDENMTWNKTPAGENKAPFA